MGRAPGIETTAADVLGEFPGGVLKVPEHPCSRGTGCHAGRALISVFQPFHAEITLACLAVSIFFNQCDGTEGTGTDTGTLSPTPRPVYDHYSRGQTPYGLLRAGGGAWGVVAVVALDRKEFLTGQGIDPGLAGPDPGVPSAGWQIPCHLARHRAGLAAHAAVQVYDQGPLGGILLSMGNPFKI